jgi:hypothetical protein
LAVATTALNFEHILFLLRIFLCTVVCFLCAVSAAVPVFDLGHTPDPALILESGFQTLNLFALFILCMSYPDIRNIFLSKPYFCLCFCVHHFALQWLPDFIPLGTNALQTFGLSQLSLSFPTCLVTFWFTLSLRQQTTQVKLFPYDEEEPHNWFRLIKAQFAAAGIKS